jgi:hypothetical protein
MSEIAERLGESLSSIKRQSVRNPEALREKVDRILRGELNIEPATEEPGECIDRLYDVIWRTHMIICGLSQPGSELRVKLQPILELTGPVIEEITNLMS